MGFKYSEKKVNGELVTYRSTALTLKELCSTVTWIKKINNQISKTKETEWVMTMSMSNKIA